MTSRSCAYLLSLFRCRLIIIILNPNPKVCPHSRLITVLIETTLAQPIMLSYPQPNSMLYPQGIDYNNVHSIEKYHIIRIGYRYRGIFHIRNIRLEDSELVSFLSLSYYLNLSYFFILILLYLFLILNLVKGNNVISRITVITIIVI